MFGAVRQPASPLKSGALCLLGCALLFWKAHEAQTALARMEAYPHEQARVESTWVERGKGGGRFADVGFGAGRFLSCHATNLRMGPETLDLRVGQFVEIVPRPGVCDTPDVPGAATSPWLCALFYAMSFGTGAWGLMILTGAVQYGRWSARAF